MISLDAKPGDAVLKRWSLLLVFAWIAGMFCCRWLAPLLPYPPGNAGVAMRICLLSLMPVLFSLGAMPLAGIKPGPVIFGTGKRWPIPLPIRDFAVMMGGIILLNGIAALVFHLLKIHSPQQHLVQLLIHSGHLPALLIFISAVFLAPISEELFFRRFLPDLLERCRIPTVLCTCLASGIFALLHGLPSGYASLTFMSVWLFRLRNRGNLLAAMLAHSLYNAFVFINVIIYVKQGNLP